MNAFGNMKRNILLSIGFLIGVTAVLQIKSIQDNTVFYSRETIRSLELEIALELSELQKSEDYLQRKKQELQELSDAENPRNLFEILERQNILASALAGKKNFAGQGLKVEIRDSDSDILPGQNPNDFIVHDQDVLRIVNDLKAAGAEVISVNNQIYRLGTEIKCSGPTITINGKTFGQPFIIRAIGNPDMLEAAIKSKDSYSYMISSLFGIRILTTKEENLFIHGSQKDHKFSYLEEATEE